MFITYYALLHNEKMQNFAPKIIRNPAATNYVHIRLNKFWKHIEYKQILIFQPN